MDGPRADGGSQRQSPVRGLSLKHAYVETINTNAVKYTENSNAMFYAEAR